MGYWKDNFPGSEAYFQRIRIARGVVGYSVICGGLLFAFSPLAKTLRKELEKGPPKDPEWITEKLSRKWEGDMFSGLPNKERFDKISQAQDRVSHLDFTRPKKLRKEIFEHQQRERLNQPTEASKDMSQN